MQSVQVTSSKITTEVLCPSGCGSVVRRLSIHEGIYMALARDGVGTTQHEEGTCDECGHTYRLPVTTAST